MYKDEGTSTVKVTDPDGVYTVAETARLFSPPDADDPAEAWVPFLAEIAEGRHPRYYKSLGESQAYYLWGHAQGLPNDLAELMEGVGKGLSMLHLLTTGMEGYKAGEINYLLASLAWYGQDGPLEIRSSPEEDAAFVADPNEPYERYPSEALRLAWDKLLLEVQTAQPGGAVEFNGRLVETHTDEAMNLLGKAFDEACEMCDDMRQASGMDRAEIRRRLCEDLALDPAGRALHDLRVHVSVELRRAARARPDRAAAPSARPEPLTSEGLRVLRHVEANPNCK